MDKIKQKMNGSKPNNSKDKGKSIFDSLVIAGVGIVVLSGAVYYLYKYLFKGEELSEEQQIEIEEIKQQIQEQKGEIGVNLAIKILNQVNKRVDELLKQENSNIGTKRRKVINNEEEYNKLCMEYLKLKETIYNRAANTVLDNFNMSLTDLKDMFDQMTPYEIEKRSLFYYRPEFSDTTIPDRQKVKEAFIFFGNTFYGLICDFKTKLDKNIITELQNNNQDLIVCKILLIKIKVEDLLILKFNLDESQLRYLLFEYSLYDDKEVKEMNDKIIRYEEMFYS